MNDIVSIVVPIYRVEKYLSRCICSVLKQIYENIEIILVDDGSTDGSAKLCDEIACTDGRVRVIHKSNGGLSDARNAGLDIAEGNYIAFVDSDDVALPGMFAVLWSRARRDHLDVSVGNVMLHDEQSGEERPMAPLSSFCDDGEVCTWKDCPQLIKAMFNVAAWNKLYRRELFDKRRFKKGIKFEDVPMWTDILFSGARLGCVGELVYQYNINRQGSIVTSRDYRGYPAVWMCQRDALRSRGLFLGRLANNFVAHLTMKFVQAYNMSSSDTRAEFYQSTRTLFRDCWPVGFGTECGMLMKIAQYVHYCACCCLPYGLYKWIFAFERVLATPKINAFLRRTFQR